MITKITILGLTLKLYDVFFVGGFVGLFILNMFLAPKFKVKRWEIMVFTILVYALTVLLMMFLYWLETGVWGGNNVVRVFVWIPVVAYPVSKLLHMDWGKACDIAGPAMLINHGISHYGCIFAGCCHGYQMENGIYNIVKQYNCFPIQTIEATSALLLTIVVIVYLNNYEFETHGSAYALTLMLFGYTRVIWEFFRDNNLEYPGIPSLGISSLQIHAAICAIVGTVWWIVYKKRSLSKTFK